MRKRIVISSIIVISFILIYWCYAQKADERGASNKTTEKSSQAVQPKDPSQQILHFNLEGYNDSGNKEWQIEGESADIIGNKINLNNIVAKSYSDKAKVTLVADKGVYDKDTRDIKLAENVVAMTDDGAKLTADSLSWIQTKESITTDGPVTLERDDIKTSGTGAVASPKLKQVELKENVRVEMKPATMITCDGSLEFDYENSVAVFNDNVAIKDERGEIHADKITAYLDKVSKKIREIIAEGNVRIVRGESSTYSDKATYIADTGKVVLSGSPKLVVYPEEGMQMPEILGK